MEEDKSRNFWNSCPRKFEYYPEVECPLGKNNLQKDNDNLPKCQWFVNSPEDKYCFWTWLRRSSTSQGVLDPLTHGEISKLLDITPSKVPSEIKEAIENLKNSKEIKKLLKLK